MGMYYPTSQGLLPFLLPPCGFLCLALWTGSSSANKAALLLCKAFQLQHAISSIIMKQVCSDTYVGMKGSQGQRNLESSYGRGYLLVPEAAIPGLRTRFLSTSAEMILIAQQNKGSLSHICHGVTKSHSSPFLSSFAD